MPKPDSLHPTHSHCHILWGGVYRIDCRCVLVSEYYQSLSLPEVYSSIFENFHLAYTNGIGQSCVGVGASVHYGSK